MQRRWEAGWGLEPSLTCLPGSLRELSLIAVRQGKFSVRRSIWGSAVVNDPDTGLDSTLALAP